MDLDDNIKEITKDKDVVANDSNDDDDDDVKLPEDTLRILNEFIQDKIEKEKLEEYLKNVNRKDVTFEENWQLSQFWYDEETIENLTKICKKITKNDSNIALLSCPSMYNSVKSVHDKVKIFEYDKRFKSFGDDFVYYDFNEAAHTQQYLNEYHKMFDIIIADPPFLSEECIEKISIIINNLRKTNNQQNDGDNNDNTTKIMFCSGIIVEKFIKKYLNLSKTAYEPKHKRNLGNDFILYTNFDIDNL